MIFRNIAAGAVAAFATVVVAHVANAQDLPAIKTGDKNKVLECATPGRLMAFLKARNEKLDSKFDSVATDYMRHGEELGMRWDYAFFQMIVETGSLKFGGDVRPQQNNFAGLGATGNGERGESFKDVSTGVRAHLEHLMMYSGEKIANPVAERTRKVQEWGVLTEWQKTIKGPMTFAQLAKKWAPPARKYGSDIEQVAESFVDGPCKGADPRPELVAAARAGLSQTVAAVAAPVVAPPAAAPAAAPAVAAVKETVTAPALKAAQTDDKISGTDLARRALEDARSEGSGQRSSLGAGAAAKAANAAAAKPAPFVLLNPPKPDADAAGPELPAATKVAAPATAKGAKPAAAQAAGCKVFQASYGGTKSVIIKAVTNDATAYTVLDVNEGAEAREADAYIAAYAPGGKQVGEFKSQTLALDKAFEMCPEG
jgi:hypothetical protein